MTQQRKPRRNSRRSSKSESILDNFYARIILVPIIILIGSYVIGVLLDYFFEIEGIFSKIAPAVGVVILLAIIYNEYWRKRSR